MDRRRLRILVCDDHPMVREIIVERLLRLEPPPQIAQAADGMEAIEKAREISPDLVIMDLDMKPMSGTSAIPRIKREVPDCRMLVLTAYCSPADYLPNKKAGIDGFLLKSATSHEFVDVVRGVLAGQTPHTPNAIRKLPDNDLTGRESEILAYLSTGVPNKRIARALCISEDTVKYHIKQIYTKLSISSRMEAAEAAQKIGLGKPKPI